MALWFDDGSYKTYKAEPARLKSSGFLDTSDDTIESAHPCYGACMLSMNRCRYTHLNQSQIKRKEEQHQTGFFESKVPVPVDGTGIW